MSLRKIRTLVVDDSNLMREIIADILSSDDRFEVVGKAENGQQALNFISENDLDLVTLDVDMPVMDGFTTLKRIMTNAEAIEKQSASKMKLPAVLMISGLTQEGASLTLKCLDAGAVDFVSKPIAKGHAALADMRDEVLTKAKSAYGVGLMKRIRLVENTSSPASMAVIGNVGETSIQVVGIGISTGGPKSLQKVVEILPPDFPPLLIVQHMPEKFTKAFAERLDSISPLHVREAADGMEVARGEAVVAPGGRHLAAEAKNTKCICRLSDTEKVDSHKPSATVLFDSIAAFGANGIGVIMTGMGSDGLSGLHKMKAAGSVIVAQEKESCVVYGMSRHVIEAGIADKVVPLNRIASNLVRLCQKKKTAA